MSHSTTSAAVATRPPRTMTSNSLMLASPSKGVRRRSVGRDRRVPAGTARCSAHRWRGPGGGYWSSSLTATQFGRRPGSAPPPGAGGLRAPNPGRRRRGSHAPGEAARESRPPAVETPEEGRVSCPPDTQEGGRPRCGRIAARDRSTTPTGRRCSPASRSSTPSKRMSGSAFATSRRASWPESPSSRCSDRRSVRWTSRSSRPRRACRSSPSGSTPTSPGGRWWSIPRVSFRAVTRWTRRGVEHRWEEERSGESWLGGPVVLSLEDVEASGCGDGYNVVIHEMAHKLDMLDGDANGRAPRFTGGWTRPRGPGTSGLRSRT